MDAAAQGMRCALCGAGADVHCAADAAFLCAPCDAQVHGANFLASRHRRTRRRRRRVRDVVNLLLIHGRLRDNDGDGAAARTDEEAQEDAPRAGRGGEGWAKRMGIVEPGAARRVAGAAARALQDVAEAPRVPLRVAMAAALWWEAAAHGVHEADGDALRRLEACAHVPARLLVAVASSMGRARVVKQTAAVDTEEGWGECSSS